MTAEEIAAICASVQMRETLGALDHEESRAAVEAEIHLAWAEEERRNGRAEAELTFGNFIKECLEPLGFYKPNPTQ